MVYKKYTDMLRKKKGNEKWVMFGDLYEDLKDVISSKDKLQSILNDLE